MAKNDQWITIDGRRIALSNLDKVLYPGGRFTKAKVIDYYVRISDYLLPHLKDHPVTLKRFPNGVYGEFFYEKDAPSFTPDWVKTFPVPRKETTGPDIRYILINDVPTLVWLANLANLEIHPFLHGVPKINQPTSIVFDCDPGEGADILDCARVSFLLKAVFDDLGLECFPKVSGSKGIQVHVPLNSPVTYEVTQPFAKAIAELLHEQHPKSIVSKMPKVFRAKKVFIDWSQNSEFKTTVAVYSLRAKIHKPHVSAPVEWDELDAALKKNDAELLYFSPDETLTRVEERGDLFSVVLKKVQKLPKDVLRYFKEPPAEKRVGSSSLETYVKKRNFTRTPEPQPERVSRSSQGSRRRFVVQKHAASHLHYDFRLEMHGVLKSWAVPKGPPLKKDEKRLAMATEDHPLEYLDFEGIIPKNQYGGGTVMVWDIGTYELIEGNYYKGFLRVHLNGPKLKGEWILKQLPGGERNKWQLVKAEKNNRAISKKRDDQSVLSQRTMAEIRDAADARWQSNRNRGPDLSKLPKAKLTFVEPMLAKPVGNLPEKNEWRYEAKLDGYRALVMKGKRDVTIYSRRGNNLNRQFPRLARAFSFLPGDTIVDGEIVVLDDNGVPSFEALQKSRSAIQQAYFYAFDVLAYEGRDVRKLPLDERRSLLEDHVLADVRDPVRISPTLDAPPRAIIEAVKEQGLEGIVAKRIDSIYESGERSGSWLKYKTNQSQEFVIGGYKPGPNEFDYLLAGYYKGEDLIFVAKIKNGFVPALRREVATHFKGLKTKVCPFANLPEPKSARRGEALTAEVMKKCAWLKPRLVAQIEFTEWTKNDHLRHSKFVGLRKDKDAVDVTKESDF